MYIALFVIAEQPSTYTAKSHTHIQRYRSILCSKGVLHLSSGALQLSSCTSAQIITIHLTTDSAGSIADLGMFSRIGVIIGRSP